MVTILINNIDSIKNHDKYLSIILIGERIKELREAKGITQESLAKQLGMKGASSIGMMEINKALPSVPQLKRLIKILDTTYKELIDGPLGDLSTQKSSNLPNQRMIHYNQLLDDKDRLLKEKDSWMEEKDKFKEKISELERNLEILRTHTEESLGKREAG